ncbi:sporulation protein Cse60 [Enterovibrio baiacu]|nr:sporulation protein Cse60 [Enterovibrio baiacu]
MRQDKNLFLFRIDDRKMIDFLYAVAVIGIKG